MMNGLDFSLDIKEKFKNKEVNSRSAELYYKKENFHIELWKMILF